MEENIREVRVAAAFISSLTVGDFLLFAALTFFVLGELRPGFAGGAKLVDDVESVDEALMCLRGDLGCEEALGLVRLAEGGASNVEYSVGSGGLGT